MGNLTRDPELRYTPKGTAVAKLGLAVNRTWKTETGETKEEVTFVDVDAFGRQAETIGQYCKKGRPLFIEGRLRLDTWDDKQTGQKRSKLGIVLESFQFLGSGNRSEGGSHEGSGSFESAAPAPRRQPAPAPRAAAQPQHQAEPPMDEPPMPSDDDVPF